MIPAVAIVEICRLKFDKFIVNFVIESVNCEVFRWQVWRDPVSKGGGGFRGKINCESKHQITISREILNLLS